MWSRQIKKKRSLAILAPMQPKHITKHAGVLSTLYLSSSLSIFVRHIEYSAFKTFYADRHTLQN